MSNNVLEYIITLKDRMSPTLNRVRSKLNQVRSSVNNAFKHPIQTIMRFKGAIIGLVGAFASVGYAIKKAFDFERMRVSFGILFKDMGKAKQWMTELQNLSASTPFQMEEITQASKYLHVFTDGALNSVKALKQIGDAAAATGNSIKDLSFWIGRAYGSIQAGRPAGEAFMRLQEMGILSGSKRNELEGMQSDGASGGEIWSKLMAGIDQYKGGMDTLSQTGHGLMSTLKDNWTLTLAEIGKQFAGVAKTGIATLIEWLKKLRDSGIIEEWGNKVKDVAARVGAIGQALVDPKSRTDTLRATTNVLKYAFLAAAQEAGNYLLKVAPSIGAAIGAGAKTLFPDREGKEAFITDLVRNGIVSPKGGKSWVSPKLNWGLGPLGGITGFSKEDTERIENWYTKKRLENAQNESVKLYGNTDLSAKEKLNKSQERLSEITQSYFDALRNVMEDKEPELPAKGLDKYDPISKANAERAEQRAQQEAARQAVKDAEHKVREEQKVKDLAQREAGLRNDYSRYMTLKGVAGDRHSRAQMAAQQAWAELKDPELFKRNQAARDKDANMHEQWDEKLRERAERLTQKPKSFLNDREKAMVRYLKAEKESEAATMKLSSLVDLTRKQTDMLERLLTRS